MPIKVHQDRSFRKWVYFFINRFFIFKVFTFTQGSRLIKKGHHSQVYWFKTFQNTSFVINIGLPILDYHSFILRTRVPNSTKSTYNIQCNFHVSSRDNQVYLIKTPYQHLKTLHSLLYHTSTFRRLMTFITLTRIIQVHIHITFALYNITYISYNPSFYTFVYAITSLYKVTLTSNYSFIYIIT